MNMLNVAELLEQTDNDWELLREAFQIFCRECPTELSHLQRHVESRDAAGIANTAHTIKGMLANFCAEEPWNAANELERAGSEGDLSAADSLFIRLRDTSKQLQCELGALLNSQDI